MKETDNAIDYERQNLSVCKALDSDGILIEYQLFNSDRFTDAVGFAQLPKPVPDVHRGCEVPDRVGGEGNN